MSPSIDHVTLSVTDAERSASWYQDLLGEAERGEDAGDGWRRVELGWPDGLALVLVQHDATPAGDVFGHARVGLDHLSLSCGSEAEIHTWAARIDELGAVRGPVEDVDYGWAVTARDPDGIAIEFFCARV